MKAKQLLASMAMLTLSAGVVMAQESVTFTNVISDSSGPGGSNPSCSGGVDVRTANLAGGYNLDNISWNGNAVSGGTGTFGSELSVRLTAPDSTTALVTLGTGTTWTGSRNFTGTTSAFAAINDPVGLWTFDFCETYNDPGIDATWTDIRFDFLRFVEPTAPVSTPVSPYNSKSIGTLAAGAIHWYSFTIWDFVDITLDTNDTPNTPNPLSSGDTEIGIYDSLGNLIANDDDSGNGFLSFLSLPGLAPGTYYVAVGAFNTTFGSTGWNVTSTATATGDYSLTITPEPGTLALLGLGALALRRRNRK